MVSAQLASELVAMLIDQLMQGMKEDKLNG
jgi:hypothetical protein